MPSSPPPPFTVRVQIWTDNANDLVLHWGVSRSGRRRERWALPPKGRWPEGTAAADGKSADTPFLSCGEGRVRWHVPTHASYPLHQVTHRHFAIPTPSPPTPSPPRAPPPPPPPSDDSECMVEVGGAVVPLQRVTLEFTREDALVALTFGETSIRVWGGRMCVTVCWLCTAGCAGCVRLWWVCDGWLSWVCTPVLFMHQCAIPSHNCAPTHHHPIHSPPSQCCGRRTARGGGRTAAVTSACRCHSRRRRRRWGRRRPTWRRTRSQW